MKTYNLKTKEFENQTKIIDIDLLKTKFPNKQISMRSDGIIIIDTDEVDIEVKNKIEACRNG